MAYDDPKLPRAVLRGENLYVGDDKEPYFRDPGYRMYLDVSRLAISGGLESDDIGDPKSQKRLARESLSGHASLEGHDSFAVAGMDVGKIPSIAFSLTTVPQTETRFVWRATIGFSTYDWEFENDEGFYIHGYVTPADFADILAAVRRGHVERLRVAIETTMWTKQKSSGFMLNMPMTFYLVPPIDKESSQPAVEWADIASITWGETYGVSTPPPVGKDSPPPAPQPIELPARLYSMLGTIIFIGAALLVLQFLKR
jgi:hypothetical protein